MGQQPIAIAVPTQTQATAPSSPEAEPKVPSAQDPPPELRQLILVRRDGQVLQAVAFTVNHGQVIYITREGIRCSLPASELDKEATRQMNDANGTSISLPQ